MVTRLDAQGKEIFRWDGKIVDISTLETLVYHAVLALGREIMRHCIEEADRILAQQRDRTSIETKATIPLRLKPLWER